MFMKVWGTVMIFYGTTFLLVHSFSQKPEVQMDKTQVIGRRVTLADSEVNEYLSIPYVQPPLGELRFKKPVPRYQYPDVLNATNVPPACPQYTENPFPWYINSSDKSEDCLYLNIWTPADASVDNMKAVMYWVYGGGFRYGSIRSKLYSGVALAALGDIIVVTVNYRLGPFGFFTSGTEDAPGNAGMWDILEGLKWVNRNIKFFGGDPSRITIAGESAGSIAIGLLAVSPLAEGLFSRQIMESGSPTYMAADNNTQDLALSQQLAKIVGCASDDFTIQEHPEPIVECLKNVDPFVLSKADSLIMPHSATSFIPQFGDKILPMNPRKAILEGKFRCTELLIGNNRDEGSFHLTTADPKTYGFFGEKNPQINKSTGADMIRKNFQDLKNSESIVQHYLPDSVSENSYDFVRYQVYTSVGDSHLLCPDVYHAEKCAEKGSRVYYYFWIHRPSTTPWAPWMGVAHFTEVQFVFGQPLLNPNLYEAEEPQISQQMIEIWSSFVKNGRPSIPWPLYSKGSPYLKYLGPGAQIQRNGKGPHLNNCEFFRPFFTNH